MNFLKRNIKKILICLLEILIGILLLINPESFTTGIVIALGVVLVLEGIFCIIGYFRTSPEQAALAGGMVKGLAMLVAGCFLILKPEWLVATFPVFTIIYGIAILLSGLYKVQWFIDSLRLKTGRWLFHLINALLQIVCAVIILANPFASTVALWMFIGISLIVAAIFDVVVLVVSSVSNSSDKTKSGKSGKSEKPENTIEITEQ